MKTKLHCLLFNEPYEMP